MSDSSNAEQADSQKSARRSGAVGLFPRLSLTKSLELVRAICDLGDGQRVRRLTVFSHLNRSSESGPGRTLIAAANSGYGLIKGSAAAEHLEPTELGIRAVSSDPQIALNAAHDALFSNAIFDDFVSHFRDKSIKNEELLVDYLRQKHKLSPQDAEACVEVILENVSSFGLTEEHQGKTVIVSRDVALEKHGHPGGFEQVASLSSGSSQATGQTTNQNGKASVPSAETSLGDAVRFRKDPEFHFNIQIHLPETATPEVYDSIFRAISVHLLGNSDEIT